MDYERKATIWRALDAIDAWLKSCPAELDESLSDNIQRCADELETYLFVASAKCQ